MYKSREEIMAMTNEERIVLFNELLEIFYQMGGDLYRRILADEIVKCFDCIEFEPLPEAIITDLKTRLMHIDW